MKITSAQLLRRPGCCVIRLSTDSGLIGIGIGDAATGLQAQRLAKAVLTGADPRGVAGLWQKMTRATASRGGRARGRAAALLDLALWDLKARSNGEPLWKTLGGARPRANAYASSSGRFREDDAHLAWFHHMADDYGLGGGKLRIGGQDGTLLRLLTGVRAAFGRATPEPVLMLDAAHRWTVSQAIRRVRALERRIDLTWVEGVSRSRDVRGLKRLSGSIAGAVCVGAGFSGISDFLLHCGSVRWTSCRSTSAPSGSPRPCRSRMPPTGSSCRSR